MNKKIQRISITLIPVLLLIIYLIFTIFSSNQSPSGKTAGRINSSTTAVAINEQLIPSYDFKKSVYITAEDLQLFGFEIKNDEEHHTINIISDDEVSFNKEYLSQLSQINENEKVFYPTEIVYIDGTESVSYTTKNHILLPVSVLNNIGKCEKSADSNRLNCTLYKTSSDND